MRACMCLCVCVLLAGMLVASSGLEGEASVWKVNGEHPLCTFSTADVGGGPFYAIRFSTNAATPYLYAACATGHVLVYDVVRAAWHLPSVSFVSVMR